MSADLFTSIAEMQQLLMTEKRIPNAIDAFIQRIEDNLTYLKKVTKEERQLTPIIANEMKLITNPISAYQFIKNISEKWQKVTKFIENNFGEQSLKYLNSEQIKFPKQEDVSGAAMALIRLQSTYRLDVKDVANGKIFDTQVQPLDALDCFDIGREAYNIGDYYHTILWMIEAREKIENQDNPSIPVLVEVLEYLAFALYKQGNLKRAFRTTEELHKIAPDHPRAQGNLKWYEDLMIDEGIERKDFRRKIPNLMNRRNSDFDDDERDIYEALCRNEVPVSVKETSKLYCYYKMDRDYLRLAPIKVEIMRHNPLVVMFRQVISDDEIEVIQGLAKPKLKRATVQNSKTGELETASYRISKSAWLRDHDHEVVNRINRRINLMTNLNQETSEELQIANYGLGGHYDPHFDFARKDENRAFETLGTGNRIATVLFYMSQPELGGATVFTDLRTAVMPSKHDALFWYNLFRNGEGDLRTRHAACPVLIGIKWVANKWIHEVGQEFHRPCGLKRSAAEAFVGQL